MKNQLLTLIALTGFTTSALAQINITDNFSNLDGFFPVDVVGSGDITLGTNFIEYSAGGDPFDAAFLTSTSLPVAGFDFVTSIGVDNFLPALPGAGDFVDFGIQVNVSGDTTQGLRLFVDGSQFGYAVGTLDLSDNSTTFPATFFGVQSTTLVLTYSETAETITATAFDGVNFSFVDSISTAGFGLTPTSEFAVSLVGASTDTIVTQGGLAVTAGTFTLNQVPEPSTYAAMFGIAALGIAVLRRRGTNAKAA